LGLIYQETMRVRTVDLGETTAVALMGTDIERIGQSFRSMHEAWAAPIEVGVGIWLLERQLSLACIAPVVIIFGTLTI
jgi:ATP-binding cassette, subfamily C (CFTR/MRP), member 1